MNYYELLEVSQNASKEVIRAAYKSLMQRYHPDKNPDNAEISKRAALLVQAYEVLSDADKRGTYDLQLKSLSETKPSTPPEERSSSVKTYRKASISEKIAEKSKASWYPGLLISVIIISGGLILFLSKTQPYSSAHIRPPAFSEKQNPAGFEQPSKPTGEEGSFTRGEREIPGRSIALFSRTLKVRLKMPDKPEETPEKTFEQATEKTLSIPILLVKVGSFDSEKFIQYLDSRKDSINLQLAEKLAEAKHEELIKADGERYLKKIILDALGDITGTNRFEDFPSSASESPGRYGVTDVVLPESFSIK